MKYASLNEMYRGLVRDVSENFDYRTSPRGNPIVEKVAYQAELTDPLQCAMTLRGRGFNPQYAIIEKLEYLSGKIDFPRMLFYNKHMEEWVNDYGFMDDSYAQKFNYWLDYVYALLKKDPDSRRAVIAIYGQADRHTSKAVPCPLSLQFLLRDNKLNLICTMRSNDLYMGFPYDVESFCFIQEVLACWLGVGLGSYVHQVGSLHIYEKHLPLLDPILNGTGYTNRANPKWNLDYEETKKYLPLFVAAEQFGRTGDVCTYLDLKSDLPECLNYYIEKLSSKWEV